MIIKPKKQKIKIYRKMTKNTSKSKKYEINILYPMRKCYICAKFKNYL